MLLHCVEGYCLIVFLIYCVTIIVQCYCVVSCRITVVVHFFSVTVTCGVLLWF